MMISIIVPNYNHARFLQQRLESIQQQSFKEFECIVLDDCSTDSSREYIQQFVAQDQRFRAVFNEENSGSTFHQWNKGLQLAAHDLIWIAESDDVADPFLLEKLLAAFEKNTGIVLAYAQSNRMNETGEVTGSWKTFTDELNEEQFRADFILDGQTYIQQFLIHRNTIPNASAVLFRKSIYQKAGGAPEQLKNNGDWLIWLKMLCYGKIAFVAASLNYFRYHSKSVIATLHQNGQPDTYNEQYDFRMRKSFQDFIQQSGLSIDRQIVYANARYLSWDVGQRGLFYLQRRMYMKGWKNVLKATIYPSLQIGFLKKALGFR